MISLLLLAFSAPTATDPPLESLQRTISLMGTSFHVEVEGVDRSAALAASEAAVRALEETEGRLSTWREDTELSRFNRSSPETPFLLSPELAAELESARRCWRETEGSFDPGAGRLFQAWGLRTGGRQPQEEEIDAALTSGGLEGLWLDGREARRSSGLILEEGAFGKGAGLDRALAAAVEAAPGARILLDAGGQLAATGGDWTVAVAHPRDRGKPLLELALGEGSVATSGNSERGLEVDGRRFSHLIDPRSGRPAPDFGSLTVVSESALWADCLATGLYVQGPDAALSFAAAEEGVEALVLEKTAEGLRARATAGLALRLRPLLSELRVEVYTPTAAARPETLKSEAVEPEAMAYVASSGSLDFDFAEVPDRTASTEALLSEFALRTDPTQPRSADRILPN